MKSNEVANCWEANAEAWTRLTRAGYDVYRDVLNTPAFLDMLPTVVNMKGLDLGCGEGTNTRAVARLGAHLTGLDIAPTFIRHAREAEQRDPIGIDYVLGDGLTIDFPDASFDFVVAFMSMMDMADQRAAFAEVQRVLKSGGFFQFSILHPCFVPPTRKNIRNEADEPIAVQVADYFEEPDGQIERWTFSAIPAEQRVTERPFEIPRFHRTLTTWVSMIVEAGLQIEAFGEPRATKQVAKSQPSVADTRIAPLFLHIRARKPYARR